MAVLAVLTAAVEASSLSERAVGLLGVVTMLLLATFLSDDRRRIDWRLVASGLVLQAGFGLLVMKTVPGRWCFERLGDLVNALLGFAVVGSRFAFGYLVDDTAPAGISPQAGLPMFAFRMLPIIIFVSSLMGVLYYLGAMQRVVQAIAWVMQRTGVPLTKGTLRIDVKPEDASLIEAATSSAAVGLRLALNVGAMLIAFIALVALLNQALSWAGGLVGFPGLTLQGLLGALLRPLAWVMGVPWTDTGYVGSLLGLKVVLNEFVAYFQLSTDLRAGAAHLLPRSAVVAVYALLGFANFASIAIQIGGLGVLGPGRKTDVARFGLMAMAAGNLAAFISASWAGIML